MNDYTIPCAVNFIYIMIIFFFFLIIDHQEQIR